MGDLGSIPGLGRSPGGREWQPTPVFLPGGYPWTEEPGGLQSMGSQRVRHYWVTKLSTAQKFLWANSYSCPSVFTTDCFQDLHGYPNSWILKSLRSDQIRSDQSLSRVRLFATPWIAAHQASLSITNSRSSLRLMFIESVMPSSHLILCRPLLLLPPILPSIRVSALASFLPKKSQGWSPLEWTGWISLQSKGLSRVFSNTTVQFFGAQLSSQSNSHIHTWPQEKP